jgi:hypothetical protein
MNRQGCGEIVWNLAEDCGHRVRPSAASRHEDVIGAPGIALNVPRRLAPNTIFCVFIARPASGRGIRKFVS